MNLISQMPHICMKQYYEPIEGSCATIRTHVFFVSSSRTAVNSGSSISIATKSSRTLEQEYLNALISSDVRSYRVGAILWGSASKSDPCSECVAERCPLVRTEDGPDGIEDAVGGGGGGVEVAMTRKVVRSKRTTSVALHAVANLARCRDSTEAFGMRVCTILDQA